MSEGVFVPPSPLVERNVTNEEDVAAVKSKRSKNLSVYTIADVPDENFPPPEQRHDRRDTVCLLRHMEEKIGYCLEEFRCQHNNFTGILYVGPLGAVFLGRFLLFEWTVVVRWEDVTKVRRLAVCEDSAIRIETRQTVPDAGVGAVTSMCGSQRDVEVASNIYDFEGFASGLVLQAALETLMGLHNDSILDQDRVFRKVTSRGSIKAPFRRSISDPAGQMSALFCFDDLPLGNRDEDAESLSAVPPPPETPSGSVGTFGTPKCNSDAADAGGNTGNEEDEAIDPGPTGIQSSSMNDDEEELQKEWKAKCTEVDDAYPEYVVRDLELPIGDLDVFMDTFLRDDAAFSWSRYMEEVSGEADVLAEAWVTTNSENESSSKPLVSTRTIEYTHPVNAPMAPPTARAQKTQILRDYGRCRGLVLETKTFVQDVPMADCFYVRDVVRVEKRRENFLMVTIRFEIVFVKSTMFQGLITRQTTSEFVAFMAGLADYTSGNCPTTGNEVAVPLDEDPQKPLTASSSTTLLPIDSSLTEDELSAEWAKICRHVEAHPEAPVRDRELTLAGGNIDAFVRAFLADDAGHSWSRYMAEIVGDRDVAATEWVAATCDDDDGVCAVRGHTRTIRYIHPVNAPMAPPTARARKEQTLWQFGTERGLVVETKTFVEGVPKTDCFYVRDVLRVHPDPTHKDRLVVNLRFEIVFIKSTFFRSVISKTTAREFTTFMTQMVEYFSEHYGLHAIRSNDADEDEDENVDAAAAVSSSLDEDSAPNEKPSVQQPVSPPSIIQPRETTANKHHSQSSSKFEIGWKILVIILLLWIGQLQNRVWNETSLLQRDFRDLRSRICDLETARSSDVERQDRHWGEWKERLAKSESARTSEALSLAEGISALNATFVEFRASRATESKSLRDELGELNSALSELEAATTTTTGGTTDCHHATTIDDATTDVPTSGTRRNIPTQPERVSETWSSKARQAATAGVNRPRTPVSR